MSIVEKNFFFFDSNNLDAVTTHLYGYCIANNISGGADVSLEDVDFPKNYSNGAYVLIQNIGDDIYISQDYNGAGAIYLFRQGDYFALSNSFLLLVEKLPEYCIASFHYDYANALLAAGLSPLAYGETMVKEIEMLPRDSRVLIHKSVKEIELLSVDYQEHSIEIASKEGLKALDDWYDKWLCVIRDIKAATDNMQCDLSGGFDSRMTFGLMAHAGINLNQINFHSIRDNLHTHTEDYAIASSIAEYFHTSLHKGHVSPDNIELGMEECIHTSFYSKLDVHKQMYWKTKYWKKARFHFTGGGGEFLRALWYKKPDKFLNSQCYMGKRFEKVDVSESIRRIVGYAYEKTGVKYDMQDPSAPELTQLMYRDTRCRHHFGRDAIESYCVNEVKICPLMDAALGKLCNRGYDDANLLIAIIMTRYYTELLQFPFEGGRSIRQETLAYAEEINRMLPFHETEINSQIQKIQKKMIYLGDNQICDHHAEKVTAADAIAFVSDTFHSDRVRRLISGYFHEDVYNFADDYSKNHTFHPLQEVYPIMGIYLTMDMLIGHGGKNARSIFMRMCEAAASPPVNPNLRLKDEKEQKSYRFSFPYKEVKPGSNIILYGAGAVGREYRKQIEESGYCRIIAWVDRTSERSGVQRPEIIETLPSYEYVVLAVKQRGMMEEIREYLLEMGVTPEKIIWKVTDADE